MVPIRWLCACACLWACALEVDDSPDVGQALSAQALLDVGPALERACTGRDLGPTPAPGALIRCTWLGDGRLAHHRVQIQYWTTSLRHTSARPEGEPQLVVASAELYAPEAIALDGARPLLVSAHGFTGLRAPCGPSVRRPFEDAAHVLPLGAKLGGAFALVPDFAGLGHDGGLRSSDAGYRIRQWPFPSLWPLRNVSHPYLSRAGEGHAIVDAVRAAHSLDAVAEATGPNPRWFVMGASQGGHAALSAAEVVAEGYTHGQLLGVLAGAPGTELDDESHSPRPVAQTLEALMIASLSLEWPEIHPAEIMTRDALRAFNSTANTSCLDSVEAALAWSTWFGSVSIAGGMDLATHPWVGPALRANSPGYLPSAAPIFVGQVEHDPFIQPARTRKYVDRARAVSSQPITYCLYPGSDQGHWSVNGRNHQAALPSMLPADSQGSRVSSPATCETDDARQLEPGSDPAWTWDPATWVVHLYEESLTP